jgi:hypothetical protein
VARDLAPDIVASAAGAPNAAARRRRHVPHRSLAVTGHGDHLALTARYAVARSIDAPMQAMVESACGLTGAQTSRASARSLKNDIAPPCRSCQVQVSRANDLLRLIVGQVASGGHAGERRHCAEQRNGRETRHTAPHRYRWTSGPRRRGSVLPRIGERRLAAPGGAPPGTQPDDAIAKMALRNFVSGARLPIVDWQRRADGEPSLDQIAGHCRDLRSRSG